MGERGSARSHPGTTLLRYTSGGTSALVHGCEQYSGQYLLDADLAVGLQDRAALGYVRDVLVERVVVGQHVPDRARRRLYEQPPADPCAHSPPQSVPRRCTRA
eukprot:708899-Rhodomonas_salina.2